MRWRIELGRYVYSSRRTSELSSHVSQRKDFRDSSGVKPGSLFQFPELWEPIEAEVSRKAGTCMH